MGSLLGSKPKTTTTTTSSIAPFAEPYFEQFFKRAGEVSGDASQFTPVQFTADQQAAMRGLSLGETDPQAYAQSIAQYQNPYDQMVLDQTIKELGRQNQGILTQIGSSASAAGGFGGSRQAVLEGEAYRNYLDTVGQQTANLKAQGFREALGQRRQSLLDTLMSGQMQQQQQQQIADADLNALRFLGEALGRYPSGAGTSQQVTGQSGGGNTLSGILQGASAIGGLFRSDRNIKENIVHIGSKNGHKLYEFTYKGHPTQKYVGVMAQDVAEYAPDAIYDNGLGYMMVDYSQLGLDFMELQNGAV